MSRECLEKLLRCMARPAISDERVIIEAPQTKTHPLATASQAQIQNRCSQI